MHGQAATVLNVCMKTSPSTLSFEAISLPGTKLLTFCHAGTTDYALNMLGTFDECRPCRAEAL